MQTGGRPNEGSNRRIGPFGPREHLDVQIAMRGNEYG